MSSPKKISPEMGPKKVSILETKKARALDPESPPPSYTSLSRRSEHVRSVPLLSLPVSIPVRQLTKSFRSRLNIEQLRAGVKSLKLSPMKATHKLRNSVESDSPISDSNGQDVSTKATDNGKKND